MRPKSEKEIKSMREGGKMLATVLGKVTATAKSGLTTKDIDELAAKELQRLGGEPAFLGYNGFPGVICVSVNDEVVHGIPGSRILKTGDIVGFDFGVRYQGLITDAAVSIIIDSQAPGRVKQLLKTTQDSLYKGIEQVHDGAAIGDIGQAIETVLSGGQLGIVEQLVGHGVGQDLHEPPEVPNYGRAGDGERLTSGMTIAIEPMATLGSKDVFVDDDGWTVKTRDGSLAAHFEHTVLVTDNGYEILTKL